MVVAKEKLTRECNTAMMDQNRCLRSEDCATTRYVQCRPAEMEVPLYMHFHSAYEKSVSLYRVQPVAAGCIIGWVAAMLLMQCPPYQYTGTHFADLGRMTG